MNCLLDTLFVQEVQDTHLVQAWNIGVVACFLFQAVGKDVPSIGSRLVKFIIQVVSDLFALVFLRENAGFVFCILILGVKVVVVEVFVAVLVVLGVEMALSFVGAGVAQEQTLKLYLLLL